MLLQSQLNVREFDPNGCVLDPSMSPTVYDLLKLLPDQDLRACLDGLD